MAAKSRQRAGAWSVPADAERLARALDDCRRPLKPFIKWADSASRLLRWPADGRELTANQRRRLRLAMTRLTSDARLRRRRAVAGRNGPQREADGEVTLALRRSLAAAETHLSSLGAALDSILDRLAKLSAATVAQLKDGPVWQASLREQLEPAVKIASEFAGVDPRDARRVTRLLDIYVRYQRRVPNQEQDRGRLGELLGLLEADTWQANLRACATADRARINGPGQRGKKKADYPTVQVEAALAKDWERARAAGEYRATFARRNQLSDKQFATLLARVRMRKRGANN